MTDRLVAPDELGRIVESWLESEAPAAGPLTLNSSVIAAARGARQRPAWLAGLHAGVGRPGLGLGLAVPRRGLQLALVLLLIAIAAALAGVAGQHVHPPAPVSGLARNGLVAFDANGQIVVVNTDGTERRIVQPTTEVQSSPVWSPDGTRLAFWTRADADGQLYLTVVDADGRNPRVVTGAMRFIVPSTTSESVRPTEVDWSPDGSRLAFGAAIGNLNRIVVATLDGRQPSVIGDPTLSALSPAWSPDGTRLAFAGGRAPDLALYVMRADGSNVRRLTTQPGASGSFYGARWSPDGSTLVYAAGDVTLYHHTIGLADASGSSERALTLGGNVHTSDTSPVWSPDGTRIAFIRSDAASAVAYVQLFVMNADGSNPTGLSNPGITVLPPRWSPDGRRILVGTADTTFYSFALIDSHGADSPIYLSTLGQVSGASWERLAP